MLVWEAGCVSCARPVSRGGGVAQAIPLLTNPPQAERAKPFLRLASPSQPSTLFLEFQIFKELRKLRTCIGYYALAWVPEDNIVTIDLDRTRNYR